LNRIGIITRASCAVLLCLPVLVFAQQPSNSALPLVATEGRIHLDVVVTDHTDKPVSGLALKDFTLLDNNQPVKIASFQAVDPAKAHPPIEVILLLDALNLGTRQTAEAQKAVDAFLHQGSGHLAQPVSIYRLADEGLSVTTQPSTDGNAVAAEIDRKKGMRVLWEHLENYHPLTDPAFQNQSRRFLMSLNALGTIAVEERSRPGRKILIWIGGGWPTSTLISSQFHEIVQFSTRLREARITLYQVTSRPPMDRDFHYLNYLAGVKFATQSVPRNLALEVLATQSGGLVLDHENDLATQIADCVSEVGAFYALSFDPPHTSTIDEYHDLQVQAGSPALAARTNTGYYNQPAYYDQPFAAGEHFTVDQLEQQLSSLHGIADSELARHLSVMELTERFINPRLADWKGRLPGPKSWDALVALADASAFLSPPTAEIPSTAPPDLPAQRKMLAQAIHYLSETIPRLPNFFATRTTISYAEQPQKSEQMLKVSTGDRSLHLESVTAGTVLYRNGTEVVDSEAVKGKKPKKAVGTLTTTGTFGSILSTVILDGAGVPGAFHWSRWDQGATGSEAVFRYAIPHDKSSFGVSNCCLADGTNNFQDKAGYHGEIAIDPTTGAILRLTLESELPPDAVLDRSATMVEFGSQVIGGSTYICPVRSVSISRGRRMIIAHEWGENVAVPGPYETILNDVSFADYHIFRSDSRILVGDPPPPDQH
jgi:VWFA-related protein